MDTFVRVKLQQINKYKKQFFVHSIKCDVKYFNEELRLELQRLQRFNCRDGRGTI